VVQLRWRASSLPHFLDVSLWLICRSGSRETSFRLAELLYFKRRLVRFEATVCCDRAVLADSPAHLPARRSRCLRQRRAASPISSPALRGSLWPRTRNVSSTAQDLLEPEDAQLGSASDLPERRPAGTSRMCARIPYAKSLFGRPTASTANRSPYIASRGFA